MDAELTTALPVDFLTGRVRMILHGVQAAIHPPILVDGISGRNDSFQ